MPNFTSGPWTWVRVLLDTERPEHYVALGHARSSATDTSVIEIDSDQHGCARLLIVNPADAALLASAPALLAALETLSHATAANPCWCPWRDVPGAHTSRCRQAREAVRAARGAEADETTTTGGQS